MASVELAAVVVVNPQVNKFVSEWEYYFKIVSRALFRCVNFWM